MIKEVTLMKQSLRIQRAGPTDYQTISDVQSDDGYSHAYYLTNDRYEKLLARGEQFYIAYSRNIPVGMFSVDLEQRAVLHFFSIRQSHINKGYGSELLSFACSLAIHNHSSILVFVETNSPLKQFLITRDFKIVGYQKNRYGDCRNAHILEKFTLLQ